ncbi:fasciclin domain-containing protein [Dietzia sp. 111N12-1]|uniref:fasciclin domain-containing protein n=1 Tax=Dietzia sp. 111N12-1 TaxID=1785156 RepID=UPI0008049352|nr:fasciclin domain-containing protein [Dietzia sp. 111N12-1]OAV79017.1 hypothetical protein AYO52_09895 [Dietzia sp. 111N12-1]
MLLLLRKRVYAVAGGQRSVSSFDDSRDARKQGHPPEARPGRHVPIPSRGHNDQATRVHVPPAQGENVALVDGNGTRINVVQTDVDATNGVIHVLDGVLMPPA